MTNRVALMLCMVLFHANANACSMFKLTFEGHSVLGCNHDAWVTEPQLKFTTLGYGAAFTGATRYQGKIAPQSGMNAHGLVFTTLSIYPPKNQQPFEGLPINDRGQFLESVLQNCKTLKEVEQYYSRYNRSCFLRDLFVYVDANGRVLFVEPFKMHYSDEPTLIQSNFCPSECNNLSEITQERFVRGHSFIAEGFTADMDFGRKLIQEMSVSRRRHGDGTLISTVWDNERLAFDVMFFHDYSIVKSFDLKQELLQGDTIYLLDEMFPPNQAFEDLKTYKTPFNTPALRFALAVWGSLSGLLGFWFLIHSFRAVTRKAKMFWVIHAFVAWLGLGYCFVLATDIAMFYFDWPYVHPTAGWRTMLSYVPILLFFVLLTNLFQGFRSMTKPLTGLKLETILFAGMIGGFLYWSF